MADGRDHQNDSIIEDGQNTEKSPGNWRRLAVSQTPVKKPSDDADLKNSERVCNNNNNNNNDTSSSEKPSANAWFEKPLKIKRIMKKVLET